jgi:hypothetical protein
MDFLQSLLPTEWRLRLFKPDEDTEPGTHIYLHIREDDVTFRFKHDVSRYDVVEFLKELHDDDLLNGEHDELFKERVTGLFLIDSTMQASYYSNIMQQFKDFKQNNVIFMKRSSIEIEHEKSPELGWVTSIYKRFNSEDEKPIAVITNKVEHQF